MSFWWGVSVAFIVIILCAGGRVYYLYRAHKHQARVATAKHPKHSPKSKGRVSGKSTHAPQAAGSGFQLPRPSVQLPIRYGTQNMMHALTSRLRYFDSWEPARDPELKKYYDEAVEGFPPSKDNPIAGVVKYRRQRHVARTHYGIASGHQHNFARQQRLPETMAAISQPSVQSPPAEPSEGKSPQRPFAEGSPRRVVPEPVAASLPQEKQEAVHKEVSDTPPPHTTNVPSPEPCEASAHRMAREESRPAPLQNLPAEHHQERDPAPTLTVATRASEPEASPEIKLPTKETEPAADPSTPSSVAIAETVTTEPARTQDAETDAEEPLPSFSDVGLPAAEEKPMEQASTSVDEQPREEEQPEEEQPEEEQPKEEQPKEEHPREEEQPEEEQPEEEQPEEEQPEEEDTAEETEEEALPEPDADRSKHLRIPSLKLGLQANKQPSVTTSAKSANRAKTRPAGNSNLGSKMLGSPIMARMGSAVLGADRNAPTIEHVRKPVFKEGEEWDSIGLCIGHVMDVLTEARGKTAVAEAWPQLENYLDIYARDAKMTHIRWRGGLTLEGAGKIWQRLRQSGMQGTPQSRANAISLAFRLIEFGERAEGREPIATIPVTLSLEDGTLWSGHLPLYNIGELPRIPELALLQYCLENRQSLPADQVPDLRLATPLNLKLRGCYRGDTATLVASVAELAAGRYKLGYKMFRKRNLAAADIELLSVIPTTAQPTA